MGKYVTCLMFTPDGSEILTQMVAVGPDSGKFDGISGPIPEGRYPNYGGALAIATETGAEFGSNDLVHICTIDLPEDSIGAHRGERTFIYFYAAVVEKDKIISQPGKNPLTWMAPKKLDTEPELFVDEGSLQYAVHLAMKKLKLTSKATQVRFRPQFL
ncbi:MAG: hypothetical protein NC311_05895 [Muribaculaceae bacterium]|nr:hypothetical protein [Muribaculaceae bacterium]